MHAVHNLAQGLGNDRPSPSAKDSRRGGGVMWAVQTGRNIRAAVRARTPRIRPPAHEKKRAPSVNGVLKTRGDTKGKVLISSCTPRRRKSDDEGSSLTQQSCARQGATPSSRLLTPYKGSTSSERRWRWQAVQREHGAGWPCLASTLFWGTVMNPWVHSNPERVRFSRP